MKDLLAGISRLIALAKRIILTEADYILVVEEYAHLLSQIEPMLAEAAKKPELRLLLQELETLHPQVMSRVERDKDKLKADITSLKKKGKVVITYTDQLPKSISMGTRRKV